MNSTNIANFDEKVDGIYIVTVTKGLTNLIHFYYFLISNNVLKFEIPPSYFSL